MPISIAPCNKEKYFDKDLRNINIDFNTNAKQMEK